MCPAHATGKPLDPANRAEDRRGDGRHGRSRPGDAPALDKDITISANSLLKRITAREVGAAPPAVPCDEIFPVNIEILDKILDMRRYLSLTECNLHTELGIAYRAIEAEQPVGHQSGRAW